MHPDDRRRSISAQLLAPLAQVPDVEWFALAKDDVSRSFPPGLALTDLTAEQPDLSHTAAMMMSLDLMIGVDTAMVHLAGALARPTWTLLASRADWRWLRDRDDTVWYPTMRLFRQASPGDWPGVIARVVEQVGHVRPAAGNSIQGSP
jgi:ADP-heptose:LPS heptosyltransferase